MTRDRHIQKNILAYGRNEEQMLKIAFIMPHWTTVFGGFSKIAQKASSFPPLNLAMLAAVVEESGHRAMIIDAEIEQIDVRETIRRLDEFAPDLVAFTATTPIFHISSDWALQVKEALHVPIAIGGFHVTLFGESVFHECFDFAFIGEADVSLRLFMERFATDQNYDDIKGLIFRKNGEVVSTGPADPANDLNLLPMPARHLLKMDMYYVGTLKGQLNYTSIMSSRGCPFKCVFCTNRIGGVRVRQRSVGNVIDEIRQVTASSGIRHFYFVDDVLTLNRAYTLQLCKAIIEAQLDITFEGSTRANQVDEELISTMKKAGLIRLSFGFETADEEIRTIIKKEVPLESYTVANRLANKYEIETINSVMLGLPGDTRESINKTIRYLRSARELKHASFSIAMPYPGTELYEMALRGDHGLKLLTQDFSQYQRYGSAVLEVNGITTEEMLRLQKIGLFKIYSVPWRLLPVLRRMGFRALLKPVISAVWALILDTVGGSGRRKADGH